MPSGRQAKGKTRLPKPNVMPFLVYLSPASSLGINLIPDDTEDRKE